MIANTYIKYDDMRIENIIDSEGSRAKEKRHMQIHIRLLAVARRTAHSFCRTIGNIF